MSGKRGKASLRLRMQAHPGIVFVTTVTGERRAALAVGPQVWTVAESWLQHDKDDRGPAAVADALGLSAADVETAVAYRADYREEIDDLIGRHHASQDVAVAAGNGDEPSMPSDRPGIRFLLDEHYPA